MKLHNLDAVQRLATSIKDLDRIIGRFEDGRKTKSVFFDRGGQNVDVSISCDDQLIEMLESNVKEYLTGKRNSLERELEVL